MSWIGLGYGLALTIFVGFALAVLAQWRDVRIHRAAEAERRRLDERTARSPRREIGRHLDRAA